MARSNWATLAMHSRWGLVDGRFEHDAGFIVEIYKSKVHVYDEYAFREGHGFRGDLVMRIEDGGCRYFDVHIDTWKPVSNEVYVALKQGYRHDDSYSGFAGCGVYGYDGDEWVGVREHQLERLREHIITSDAVRESDFVIPEEYDYNQGDQVLLERATGETVRSAALYDNDNRPILEQILDEMDDTSGSQ